VTERSLIPAAGLCVVDPATGRALPTEGKLVRGNDEYWIRRLDEGDVALSADPASPSIVDSPKPKAKLEQSK
jgi:hypothetical protein